MRCGPAAIVPHVSRRAPMMWSAPAGRSFRRSSVSSSTDFIRSRSVGGPIWSSSSLRVQVQAFGRPVWADFVATAAIVIALVLWLSGGMRAGWRPLINCLAIFVGIGIVIAVMGLDRGGFPIVDTRLWGGLLVTLVVAVTGIVASMPVGIALALGRRSSIPLIRIFSIAFIEFWRGVPLITVLFFATYMLPLFVPTGFTIDGLMRALIGIALFTGAYQAENIRGGLAAIPRGQGEAASALGLSWGKTTALIVMPQALRHVIPNLVNSFISLFKDTSLVSIVALFDRSEEHTSELQSQSNLVCR